MNNMLIRALLIIGILTSYSALLAARTYPLPPYPQRLIGEPIKHQVSKGDYFQLIAEQYNVGFLALMAANAGVDPFLSGWHVSQGLNQNPSPQQQVSINIPSQMLLPYGKREGIVINLPELRLYYFEPNKQLVHVFPVGIGREGLATPKTTSYIGEKRKNPTWRPTAEMKARYLKEKGQVLADEVPPGPNNPFGKYALRLGTSQYLIHGTNQRFGVGTRASSGCIRMYDDDIKWLFDNVPSNTKVKIIDQPVKMSYEQTGVKLFEVHQPLTSPRQPIQLGKSWNSLMKFVGEPLSDRYRRDFEAATGLVVTVDSGLTNKSE